MKVGLPQLSISDRVNAAKTSPSATDTSSIPTSMNPSPGDSQTAPIDASQINRAGSDVNQKSQEGNRSTADSARKGQTQEATNTQYDKQTVSSADQAPTAAKGEDLAQTPAPKSKGFKESLIDQQMASMMGDKTGGDHPAQDRDFGHDNGNPNEHVKPAPEAQPLNRNKMAPYDNSRNRVPEPGNPSITSFDKENNMEPYKGPKENFGPAYNQKSMSTPKVKFNTPRINTPRFK
jgi:hypothetical protein